jgi:hypothetical protein
VSHFGGQRHFDVFHTVEQIVRGHLPETFAAPAFRDQRLDEPQEHFRPAQEETHGVFQLGPSAQGHSDTVRRVGRPHRFVNHWQP